MNTLENTQAPDFHLANQNKKYYSLSDFKGKKIVLYFYPKDMTPGCTTETLGFQDLKSQFEQENTVVIGISKDSSERHQKFCEKHNLNIILLADTEVTTIKDYKVWKEKSMFGKKYMGISRESFLVNEKGLIIKHWQKVKPNTHPQEVLEYIKKLT